MSAPNSVRLVSVVFSLVGLCLLAAAAGAASKTRRFLARSQQVPGRVVDLSSRDDADGYLVFRPVIEYQAPSGRTVRFTARVESRTPDYDVGEIVALRFDPDSPRHVRVDCFSENWLSAVILAGMGAIFGGIGQGIFWFRLLRRRRNDWLRRHGRRTRARIEEVRLDTSLQVDGRSPFRIVARGVDPSGRAVQVFESEPIWFDPSEFARPDAQVEVLVDPHDPARYWMNTGFLPRAR